MGSMWRQLQNGFFHVVLLIGPLGCLGGELPDPTRPLAGSVPGTGAQKTKRADSLPVLGSVLVGPHRRLAIIDGKRYRENDLLGSYRLVSIEEDRVTLQDGTKRVELKFLITTRIKEMR